MYFTRIVFETCIIFPKKCIIIKIIKLKLKIFDTSFGFLHYLKTFDSESFKMFIQTETIDIGKMVWLVVPMECTTNIHLYCRIQAPLSYSTI